MRISTFRQPIHRTLSNYAHGYNIFNTKKGLEVFVALLKHVKAVLAS
jgi:hypothetical protein